MRGKKLFVLAWWMMKTLKRHWFGLVWQFPQLLCYYGNTVNTISDKVLDVIQESSPISPFHIIYQYITHMQIVKQNIILSYYSTDR